MQCNESFRRSFRKAMVSLRDGPTEICVVVLLTSDLLDMLPNRVSTSKIIWKLSTCVVMSLRYTNVVCVLCLVWPRVTQKPSVHPYFASLVGRLKMCRCAPLPILDPPLSSYVAFPIAGMSFAGRRSRFISPSLVVFRRPGRPS